jgi:hypothetical protein
MRVRVKVRNGTQWNETLQTMNQTKYIFIKSWGYSATQEDKGHDRWWVRVEIRGKINKICASERWKN